MSHFGQPAALRKRLIKFALISKNWAEVLILMAVLQLIFTSAGERQWQTNRHWCFHPATSRYREGSQELCVYTSLSELPFRFSLLHLYFWPVKAKMEKIQCYFNCTSKFLFSFLPFPNRGVSVKLFCSETTFDIFVALKSVFSSCRCVLIPEFEK